LCQLDFDNLFPRFDMPDVGDTCVLPQSMAVISSEPEYKDAFDDVFESADSTTIPGAANDDVSEDSRLRSIHVTNGYRDGVAESKTLHVQSGFDEGYPLGAVLGFKASWILTVLGSVCSLTKTAKADPEVIAGAERSLSEATRELAMDRILSPQYFGEDGVWSFPVPGENESACDFDQVGASHPLIVRWMARVKELTTALGLDIQQAAVDSQSQP